MKKIVLLVGVICILLGFSYFGNKLRSFYQENKDTINPIVNLQSPTKPQKNSLELPYQNKTLLVSWVLVEDSNSISLFSNLNKQQTARELLKEKQCKTLINGGFYTKEDKHIGTFVTEGESINNSQKNKLFNGVFSATTESAQINEQIPEGNIRFAVQAGPVLIKDGVFQNLETAGEGERRTAVGITSDNKVVFLSIYQKDSAYLGPKLIDLPNILKEYERVTGIILVSALNLDGGTASAFLTESVSLGELTPIGSYFCIK